MHRKSETFYEDAMIAATARVHQLYLKRSSFEVSKKPRILYAEEQPIRLTERAALQCSGLNSASQINRR
jgi:preprotein translocase subunit SecB